MTIKEMKQTIRTYKDWELEKILTLLGDDESTKQRMIINELQRRANARKSKTYQDETLDPKIPVRKRLVKA